MAETAISSVDVTPVRRRIGASTDDAAIFLEDTVDRATAQCIDASPSALALLTPQRLPAGHTAHVDVTEYDASHLGSLALAHRRSGGGGGGSSGSRGRPSGHRTALHDVTNTSSGRVSSSSSGAGSKSPTPTATRCSEAHTHRGPHRHSSHNSSLTRSTPRHSTRDGRSPAVAEPMVPLADYEALQHERNRFEKMYEHQRALYEEMAEKQAETYQLLQDKIIEVVALSTRNEESKRFIRQLKREFAESRTRVMEIQNKALEEAKAERSTKSRYEALLQSHERRYERLADRHETKLAGMESLIKDLTCLRGEQDQLHVSQLDSLLKAAYAKSTALFSDLLRQGRQIDLLYDAKSDVENQLDQLRRERREMEATLREERRRGLAETERLIEQVEEQQQSILNLRQMLIRTMDNRDNVFAYSRGPRRVQGGGEEGNEEGATHNGGSSSSSSFSSSPPSSIAADDAEERSFGEDDDNNEQQDDDDGSGSLHRDKKKKKGEVGALDNPLSTASRQPRSGGPTRPVVSASTAVTGTTPKTTPSLSSNAVVVPIRGPVSATSGGPDVPPLPLLPRAATEHERGAAPSITSARQDAAYRIQRTVESASSNSSSGAGTTRSLRGFRECDDATEAAHVSAAGHLTRVLKTHPVPLAVVYDSAKGKVEGGEGHASPTPSSSSSSSSSLPVSPGASSRRRLDFTTALAAVTEKRRRDRAAREGGENAADTSTDAISGRPSVWSEVAKENSSPAEGPRRVIVRSCAVGSIATARSAADASPEEDEEEPRLFPRSGLRARE